MNASAINQLLLRIAGVCISAAVAWQAVRYYRGEISLPGYDHLFHGLFRVMSANSLRADPLAEPLATLASLPAAMLSVSQVVFAVLLLSLVALRAIHYANEAAWRAQLGKVAYSARRQAARSKGTYSKESTVARKPEKASGEAMGWFDAFLWLPVTIGLCGIGVFAVVAIATKVEAMRMSIGVSWFTIGDLAVIAVVGSIWTAAAAGQVVTAFRQLHLNTDDRTSCT